MINAVVSAYRCPNCGYQIITHDQLGNGEIQCGNCELEMKPIGHLDIFEDEN